MPCLCHHGLESTALYSLPRVCTCLHSISKLAGWLAGGWAGCLAGCCRCRGWRLCHEPMSRQDALACYTPLGCSKTCSFGQGEGQRRRAAKGKTQLQALLRIGQGCARSPGRFMRPGGCAKWGRGRLVACWVRSSLGVGGRKGGGRSRSLLGGYVPCWGLCLCVQQAQSWAWWGWRGGRRSRQGLGSQAGGLK